MRHAIKLAKPCVLIWEADPEHGGAPLDELRQKECPPGLRASVFDVSEVVQWHRAADFQLLSLKLIAERVLLASPAYADKRSLPLVMPGELLEQELVLPSNVRLLVSEANPGVAKAAHGVCGETHRATLQRPQPAYTAHCGLLLNLI